MLQRSGALLCFAIAWVLVGAGIRAAVPWPEDMRLAERMQFLADHPGDFDTLYFGTSQVYRSFVPGIIDATAGRGGRSIRSFNLGAPGMSVFEMDFWIREALTLPGQSFRTIVFEYGFHPHENPERILNPFNYFSNRAIYWHTPARTRDVLRVVTSSFLPATHRLQLASLHTRHAAWRLGAVGQGPRILAAQTARTPPEVDDLARNRGYRPLEDETEAYATNNREAFLASPPGYRAMVKALAAHRSVDIALDDLDLRPLRSLQAAIRRHGAEPIVVVTAFPYATPALDALANRDPTIRVIALNSPRRHPSLYRADRRFDGLHLNRTGAAEFSRVFAALLVAELDRSEP